MLLGHSARLRSGVRSPMGNDGILRVMAEADDMQSLEALLRRVDALDGTRDAYAVALEVRDILDAGLDLLYRGDHRGELPRNPKLPERMGARTGRAFLAEANLTEAAEFIRVVGCNALNGRKVKVTQAAQAVKNVRLVVQALQAKQDPSAPLYVPCRPLTEAQTRREYIDVYLQEAGWEVLGEKDVALPGKAGVEIRVEGMPPDGQDGYCDYVLGARDTGGGGGAPPGPARACRLRQDRPQSPGGAPA